MQRPALHGAGLGFRRDHLVALETQVPDCIDFFEVAPENWIGTDKTSAKRLRAFTERFPYQQAPDLLIDTHGEAVIDPVWDLLDFTYQQVGVFPTLLERDYNIPPLEELVPEVAQIARLQRKYTA